MKYILTDIDDTILHWRKSFITWMEGNGYEIHEDYQNSYELKKVIKNVSDEELNRIALEFNSSSHFACIPPYEDARIFVPKVYKDFGMKFIGITTCSHLKKSRALRELNISSFFPEEFERMHVLPLKAKKHKILKLYRNKSMYWIEDSIKNAHFGINNGFRTYLRNQTYNTGKLNSKVIKFDSLLEVYSDIKEYEKSKTYFFLKNLRKLIY